MKKIDNVQEVTDRWQYIMLAVAIFLAIIFCCYYIISQSRWGFYTAGGPVRQQANVLGADESSHLTMGHPGTQWRYWISLINTM